MNALGPPSDPQAKPPFGADQTHRAIVPPSVDGQAPAALSLIDRASALNQPGPRNILVAALSSHPAFLPAISRHARERGWRLISDMLHTGAMPTRWHGDGILTFASYSSDLTEWLNGAGVPYATVSLSAECKAVPRVQPDNVAIGRLAAYHLLERDCREFIWAPFSDDTSNQERLRGFQSVLEAQGCECDSLPPAHRRIGHAWHDNWTEWRQAVLARLELSRGNAGLFAFNDCLSAKIMAAARETGLAMPHDLAVLGVGNDSLDCESGPLTLTSIDPDIEGMAGRAAELLDELLTVGRCDESVVLYPPKGVVTRDSTGSARLESSRLHQAITYVAGHLTDPRLSVALVADKIGISRRQLERDFRNLKRCTVREFIEDLRMQNAGRLVIEHPQAKILTIAETVGISDPYSFFRKFRKKLGVTPMVFRGQCTPSGETASLTRRVS